MLVALPGLGFGLLLMAFMPNLWTTAVMVMAFFFAYYTYEAPYRGLYPDVLPPTLFGRSQSVQHILRGLLLDRDNRYPEVEDKLTDLRALPAALGLPRLP